MQEPIVFVMQGEGKDDYEGLFVAVTALTWAQLRPTQFLPVRNLYEATRQFSFADSAENIRRLRPLYEAVRGI